MWPFFYVGACNVIMKNRSFDPAATLQTIQDEKITDMQIVPTQLVVMLNRSNVDQYDLSSLKRMYYAASPMPVEILRRGLQRFGPIFAQGYGQTESGPQTAFLPGKAHEVLDRPPEEQKVLRSIGHPSLGTHFRIVDENNEDVGPEVPGEIIIESDFNMVGYWKKPEETAEVLIDGWLHTGDIGCYDEKGYIYIVDRKKDMIISGGENVYPREIEEVLYGHPAIEEAAVIGMPDPVWVERVHAVVTLKEGTTAREDDIIGFCKKHLASYKAPKSVEFVASLPKNPQGKILKRALRSRSA
jgi:acyl-CoA synthetase (AMP-forming)/AMP-acid ligase II